MELRECPFCGGDFVIEVVCRDWDDYMIDCGCGCSFHFPYTSRDELIMRWNRRADDRIAKALGALRKIAAIENRTHGGDWDEIEDARLIARDAIYAATGEETRYTVTPAGLAMLKGGES